MARALELESLETKSLLAADVSFDEVAGVLKIKGTVANDQVIVSQNGFRLEVSQSGLRNTFNAKQVSSILFEGGDGDDQFVNNTRLPSVAYGNRGRDTLVGGGAADDMHGGPDDDRLVGNDGDDQLHGDYGNDVLVGGRGNDQLLGWYGNDLLQGDDGNDYLSGYEGDDVLTGGNGDDELHGHEGNDKLLGGDGNDLLYGWLGNDSLFGGDGNDYLSGWAGDDLLLGGDGNDQLLGHAGKDLLIGGRGADGLEGGSDADILFEGWTRYDDDLNILASLHATWIKGADLKSRIDALTSSKTGPVKLDNSSVKTENKVVDNVGTVEAGLDWVVRFVNGNSGSSGNSGSGNISSSGSGSGSGKKDC